MEALCPTFDLFFVVDRVAEIGYSNSFRQMYSMLLALLLIIFGILGLVKCKGTLWCLIDVPPAN